MSGSFPEMHALAAALGADHAAILDGEVCAFAPDGRSDFGLLQNRTHVQRPSPALLARTPVRLMIFDLLHLGGASLLERSYDQRREQLLGLGLQDRAWATPAALTGPLTRIQDASRQHGLEGIVHKRHDSTYLPGRRTPHWRKTKNLHEQTAVVVGWKPGERGRAGQIGALPLAVHAPNGQLEYIGNVGTASPPAPMGATEGRASRQAPLVGKRVGSHAYQRRRPAGALTTDPRDRLPSLRPAASTSNLGRLRIRQAVTLG